MSRKRGERLLTRPGRGGKEERVMRGPCLPIIGWECPLYHESHLFINHGAKATMSNGLHHLHLSPSLSPSLTISIHPSISPVARCYGVRSFFGLLSLLAAVPAWLCWISQLVSQSLSRSVHHAEEPVCVCALVLHLMPLLGSFSLFWVAFRSVALFVYMWSIVCSCYCPVCMI